jgi:hypothetical protein
MPQSSLITPRMAQTDTLTANKHFMQTVTPIEAWRGLTAWIAKI